MTATAPRRFMGFLAASLLVHGAVLVWLHPPRGAPSGSGAAVPMDMTLVSTPPDSGATPAAAHHIAREPTRRPLRPSRHDVPKLTRTTVKHAIARRRRMPRQPAQGAHGTVPPHSTVRAELARRAPAQHHPASGPSPSTSNSAAGTGPRRATRPHAGGPHTAAGGTLTLRLQQVLNARLTRYFRYPPLARRRGWQGRVIVSLSINRRGQLSDLKVVHSSGYPVLDQAALHSLRQVGRVPLIAAWVDGRDVKVELPVRYRLVNS